MNNLVLASSSAEAQALETAQGTVATAAGRLGTLGNNLISAAGNSLGGELASADQSALVDFAQDQLIPLAQALADGAGGSGVPALQGAAATHLARLVLTTKDLEIQETTPRMLFAAGKLSEAAEQFIAAAAESLLPELAQNPAVSLADLLPAPRPAEGGNPGGSQMPASPGCACGGHDEPGLAELDTRVIPHAIRHATIFGALEGLKPGKGILLIANHNPLPLLAQLEQRSPNTFAVDYVADGPEVWKLSMVRKQA